MTAGELKELIADIPNDEDIFIYDTFDGEYHGIEDVGIQGENRVIYMKVSVE